MASLIKQFHFRIEQRGPAGIVLAAEHRGDGTTIELAKLTGARLNLTTVTAEWTGTSQLPTGPERLNVNRPTQGEVHSGEPEQWTPEAMQLYVKYRSAVLAAARGPLRLYIELHSNDDPHTAAIVEVASVNLTLEQAAGIKLAFRTSFVDLIGYDIVVEPADQLLRWQASMAKAYGAFALPDLGLQIELPEGLLRTIMGDGDAMLMWIAFMQSVLSTTRPQVLEAVREAITRGTISRTTTRLRDWLERKIDTDGTDIARLYKSSRDALVTQLRTIYDTYLSTEPTFVRARTSGAGRRIDSLIDQDVNKLATEIGQHAVSRMTQLTQEQRRQLARHRPDLPEQVTAPSIAHELTTSVVGGGTFGDRLFHVTDGLKSSLVREIRQSLLGSSEKEPLSFDELRSRVHKVFGVDKLSEPKESAYGSVKIYKNEARRQWNLLMEKVADRHDAKQVWFAALTGALAETTTPGCAARHGFDLDDLGEVPPRHFNCRCTIMVVEQDEDLTPYQQEGAQWLAKQGYTRRQAQAEEAAARPLGMTGPWWQTERAAPYERVAVYCPGGSGKVWAVKPHGQNFWTLPGGHINPEESEWQAAVREMAEETGVVVELERWVGDLGRSWSTTHVYLGRYIKRGRIRTPDEVSAVGIVPLDDLRQDERGFLMATAVASEIDAFTYGTPTVPQQDW